MYDWDEGLANKSYTLTIRYYCPLTGWGYPSNGMPEMFSVCQADKQWSLQGIEECISMAKLCWNQNWSWFNCVLLIIFQNFLVQSNHRPNRKEAGSGMELSNQGSNAQMAINLPLVNILTGTRHAHPAKSGIHQPWRSVSVSFLTMSIIDDLIKTLNNWQLVSAWIIHRRLLLTWTWSGHWPIEIWVPMLLMSVPTERELLNCSWKVVLFIYLFIYIIKSLFFLRAICFLCLGRGHWQDGMVASSDWHLQQ